MTNIVRVKYCIKTHKKLLPITSFTQQTLYCISNITQQTLNLPYMQNFTEIHVATASKNTKLDYM